MKTVRYFLLFLLIRMTEEEQIDCNKNKMHAAYYATRCCSVTFPHKDKEYTKCHAKFTKMSNRTTSKLTSLERIAVNICSHECSLLAKDFIREKYHNEFDFDIIEDYYLDAYKNPVFSAYMIDAFRKCVKFDSSGEVHIKYPNVSFIPHQCDPLAARVMMCVRTKAMQTCPSAAWESSSFDCAAARLYFRECVGSIEKVIRTMD